MLLFIKKKEFDDNKPLLFAREFLHSKPLQDDTINCSSQGEKGCYLS